MSLKMTGGFPYREEKIEDGGASSQQGNRPLQEQHAGGGQGGHFLGVTNIERSTNIEQKPCREHG